MLNRHPATIGREIKRNGAQIRETMYRSNRAQVRANARKKKAHQKNRLKNEIIQDYVVHKRKPYGHRDADTVVSRKSKSALVVVRERKMHVMLVRKIPRKTAEHSRRAIIQMLRRFPERFVKSITFDNGLENADHKRIANASGIKTYFCNPYHGWEKGGVENGIGLIRRYFPKKTDFSLISYEKILSVEERLNNRPRKTLGFLTSLEVLKIALSH
jgi:transposase, IS30 family